MNILVGSLAFLSALVLTATAVSLFALRRAYALTHELNRRHHESPPAPAADERGSLRDTVEALTAQVHELQRTPSAAALDPGFPRPAFNLTRRSQALRMHRHGESAGQIATALSLPRQEVDLLLKVHRIVISNV